jgi:hypothetical protein
MRGVLLSLICAAGIVAAAPAMTSAAPVIQASISATPAPVYALQVPDKKIDISVTNNSGGGRWYRSPLWIAIGSIAGVIILLLIVLIARGGGGTTIVKG